MFMQDVDHASFKDTSELRDRIESLNPKRYAIALHDQDTDDFGKPVRDHWHAMMSFKNARSAQAIAKALGEPPQYVQAWRGDARNGYAYLTHRTKDARMRHQYDPNDVVANFDYPSELQKLEAGAAAARTKAKTNVLLDALYDGEITLDELKSELTGSQLGSAERKINAVWNARLEREAKEWRQMMLDQGRRSETIWLTGKAGTGRTSMAKELCAGRAGEKGYYVSGSTRDLFQNYAGQHHLILDELSPDVVPYADLKRIMDPFAGGDNLQAPSRFRDKHLMPETIVVTSIFDPYTLYRKQVAERHLDPFDQLLRTLDLVLELTDDEIRTIDFDEDSGRYRALQGLEVPNPYSTKARGRASTTDPAETFSALADELDLT